MRVLAGTGGRRKKERRGARPLLKYPPGARPGAEVGGDKEIRSPVRVPGSPAGWAGSRAGAKPAAARVPPRGGAAHNSNQLKRRERGLNSTQTGGKKGASPSAPPNAVQAQAQIQTHARGPRLPNNPPAALGSGRALGHIHTLARALPS